MSLEENEKNISAIDIEDNEDWDAEDFRIERYDIASYPADYTIKTLLDNVNNNRIELPKFQRKFVWDVIKQSRLIESFLLGLPVPQIFLFRKPDDPKLYIIDGFQRIYTLKRFYNNKFALKGVNKKWEGKCYKDLDEDDRSFLDESTLRAIIIRQISPKDDSSMYYIFERLNTGGVTLSPMEIRKAIYYGKFYEMLEESNKDKNWKKIIGKPDEDKRLRDIEWILRFFAFYLTKIDEYHDPMKEFLNRFMRKNRDLYNENLKKVFKDTCRIVIENFGDKPFHFPKGRLNLAVMDSVMVSIAKSKDKSNLKEKFERLKKDDKFVKLIQERDTSKAKILKERFKIAYNVFGVEDE